MLTLRTWLLLVLTLLAAPLQAATRPKLVVLLVVDQFRADYLERFRAEFGSGGFNRLLTGGAVFANNYYDYANAETAPGHATLATGADPASHGIIGNEWYDRALQRSTSSVQDTDYKLVGGGASATGASPRKIIGSTLADEIRLASDGKARAIGISLKDRAAILPAGKTPTAAFWVDTRSGRVITSSYYMDELPGWVKKFNEQFNLLAFAGRAWRALGAPAAAPPLATIAKVMSPLTDGGVGPDGSPWANEMVLELARRAVLEYKLGRGPATDFLSLSFSANDYVGHSVGPDSPLVHDLTLRTDRLFADLFRFLDQQVGAGNYVVAFSADHGVTPLPEVLREKRIEAGRVRDQDVERVVEDALRTAYGSQAGEKWVALTDLPDVYLDQAMLEKYKAHKEDAAHRAGEAALHVPGILTYFTADRLAGCPEESELWRRVTHGFFPARSGDLLVVWKPFYHRSLAKGVGTNHNSPWSYDTHVPLIFMGPGFRPGLYRTSSTPADLAPTISALLEINKPSASTGRVLAEALAESRAAAARAMHENSEHGSEH